MNTRWGILGTFVVCAFVVPATVSAQLATDLQCTGCVQAMDLAGNSVNSAKIVNGSISTLDITDGTITTTDIADNSLTATDIFDGAGSLLDADWLDGLTSAQFLRADQGGTLTGALTITGKTTLEDSLGIGGSAIKPLTIYTGDNDAIALMSNTSDDWYVGPNVVTSGFGIYDVTKGASRFHISLDGNIGMGTPSPVHALEVVSTNDTSVLIHANETVNDRNARMELRGGNSDAGALSILKFNKTAGSTSERLVFQNGSDQTMMVLTGSGNVGIGSFVDPPDSLSVYMPYVGNVDTRISLANDYVNMGLVGRSNEYGQFRIGLVDDSGYETLSSRGGKIGIGTTIPNFTLDVNGDINGNRVCVAGDCRTSWPADGEVGVNGVGVAGRLAKWTDTDTLDSTALYVASSNLGIDSGGDSVIDLGIGDTDTGLQLVDTDALAIYTAGTERLRVTSGGNVKIINDLGIGVVPNIDLAIGDDDTGFKQEGDGVLSLFTNNARRMIVNSIGNIGINTSAADTKYMLRVDIAFSKQNFRFLLH